MKTMNREDDGSRRLVTGTAVATVLALATLLVAKMCGLGVGYAFLAGAGAEVVGVAVVWLRNRR